MQTPTIRTLANINREFYEKTAVSFANTRSQKWSGWDLCLENIRKVANSQSAIRILDLGCGNGRFYQWLTENLSQPFSYLGIDNNDHFLQLASASYSTPNAQFQKVDLIDALLRDKFPYHHEFDVMMCSGVFHHLPDVELRRKLITNIATALTPQGLAITTFWQFDHLTNLFSKKITPITLHIPLEDLEQNDYFLSWQGDANLIRYCHLTTPTEQKALFQDQPIKIVTTFSADGLDKTTNDYWLFTSSV